MAIPTPPIQGLHQEYIAMNVVGLGLKSSFFGVANVWLFQTSCKSVPRDGSYIGARCSGSSWVFGTSQRLCRFPLESLWAEIIGSSRLQIAHPCQGMGLTMKEHTMPIRAKGWVLRWKSTPCPPVPRDGSYAEIVDSQVVPT